MQLKQLEIWGFFALVCFFVLFSSYTQGHLFKKYCADYA